MFSLIFAWINGWVNNREAGDLRRYRVHYDAIVMVRSIWQAFITLCNQVEAFGSNPFAGLTFDV